MTKIGSRAFASCEQLKSVTLPESLVVLGSYAFAGCTALTDIELPDRLEVLNKGTFEGTTVLEEVGLPYGLRRIGMECFKDCTSLTTLYYFSKRGISDVMTTDRDLREDVLPTLVDYIGVGAFENCAVLTRMDVPYGVTSIAARAFAGCSSLRHVALHNRVREIGKGRSAAVLRSTASAFLGAARPSAKAPSPPRRRSSQRRSPRRQPFSGRADRSGDRQRQRATAWSAA
ncbi:leucine-rich repeat domain-containing protein [Microbacterium sp. NIBRBAC000506063]|uniref:leucine-rich repeat domain-containing protein n=1 Tax=Microbacterium sp. NIBRBAC000506063 TaxID=2734618 RepID=UPI001BB6C812|nr:leucine-rich repeat domain-containing protein [Microbacterium sp. NIBRBAC000506063]QTV80570.1 leucine-rich repeat domain-containing protein [Microbacterium sp. NIBRBAC000506063]